MSKTAIALEAEIREGTGKGVARALRREGRIPAVIYGKKGEVNLSLSRKDVQYTYKKGGFTARLVEIKTDKQSFTVIPRDIQLHPLNELPLHVDFMHVDDDTKVKVWVKVQFINSEKSPGLKRGGVLNIVRRKVELLCSAGNIPESLEADLSGLRIGDSVHINTIKLPEGAAPTIERNFTIAAVTGRGAKADEAETDEAEGEGESAEEKKAE